MSDMRALGHGRGGRHARRNVAFAALVLVAVATGPPAPASAAGAGAKPAYAKRCNDQSRLPSAGTKTSSYARCVRAMTRLARAHSRSPVLACGTLSRKRLARTRTSAFARCVRSGTALIRNGNGIDRAYVDDMIPHHVAAVEMARLALTQGESEYIRALGASIIRSQNAEIATMRAMSAKLRLAGIGAVDMRLSQAQMGMDHDMSHLAGISPFDVPFVDMMIPHHQGAITMSNVLFARGVGRRTRALAEQIVSAQTREILAMREFRRQLTGTPEPPPGAAGDHPH